MFTPRSTLLLLVAVVGGLGQVGCALNIPSQRFHDPADHGGLLGHWKQLEVSQGEGHHAEFHGVGESCASCETDPVDVCDEQAGNVKPPEVPWPRYHPVPTRPIFGNLPSL